MKYSGLANAALALLSAVPATARAYSDPTQFDLGVLEAGGGGRFYTGSPADGYACNSCHTGGEEPAIEVSGMPERFVPGAAYELRVRWPTRLEHAAAILELTDARGFGAGSLSLPPADEYLDDELCAPADAGVLGAQLYAADRSRSIAATPDCGASLLRVQWTAPKSSQGPIWLAGAVLASNHDGDVGGDGVAVFAQPVPKFGEALPDVVATGSCSIAPAVASGPNALRRRSAIAWTAFVLVTLTSARRRQRVRR